MNNLSQEMEDVRRNVDVHALQRENMELREENAQLRNENGQLQAQIEQLRDIRIHESAERRKMLLAMLAAEETQG